MGSAVCPQPAAGSFIGVGIPGALITEVVQGEACKDCAPIVVAWLTRATGVQPVWTPRENWSATSRNPTDNS